MAFKESTACFTPNGFSSLQRQLKDESRGLGLRPALALLRLSQFDPDVFYKFKQARESGLGFYCSWSRGFSGTSTMRQQQCNTNRGNCEFFRRDSIVWGVGAGPGSRVTGQTHTPAFVFWLAFFKVGTCPSWCFPVGWCICSQVELTRIEGSSHTAAAKVAQHASGKKNPCGFEGTKYRKGSLRLVGCDEGCAALCTTNCRHVKSSPARHDLARALTSSVANLAAG